MESSIPHCFTSEYSNKQKRNKNFSENFTAKTILTNEGMGRSSNILLQKKCEEKEEHQNSKETMKEPHIS